MSSSYYLSSYVTWEFFCFSDSFISSYSYVYCIFSLSSWSINSTEPVLIFDLIKDLIYIAEFLEFDFSVSFSNSFFRNFFYYFFNFKYISIIPIKTRIIKILKSIITLKEFINIFLFINFYIILAKNNKMNIFLLRFKLNFV